MRIIPLIVIVLVAGPSLAAADSSNPIRYKVDANNRLFLSDEGVRYVDDLNKYLRCSDG